MWQPKKLLLIIGSSISILLITRVIVISPRLVDTVTSWFVYPVLLVTDGIIKPFKERSVRRQACDTLVEQVLASKQLSTKLLAENIALRAELVATKQVAPLTNFLNRYKGGKPLYAQIILKHLDGQEQFILLDVGEKEGVVANMIAVYENCLLGRVTDVHPHYAKVLLMTDRLSKVPALALGTGSQGIVEGLNDTKQLQLSFVSHLTELTVGDMVLSSGDGLIYPRGFALGTIEHVELNALGVTYLAMLKPMVNVQDIHFCCLVDKGVKYEEPAAEELEVQGAAQHGDI